MENGILSMLRADIFWQAAKPGEMKLECHGIQRDFLNVVEVIINEEDFTVLSYYLIK